jgi:hypothetical protein
MPRRFQDLVAQRAAEGLKGRSEELSVLFKTVKDDTPLVLAVHGIGGIGKSSLLTTFAARARASGAAVALLDSRTIEPTERAFLHELNRVIGGDSVTPGQAAARLGAIGSRVILILDAYEVLRAMDTWLRHSFVPILPENVRVIFAGRDQPVSAWYTSPGWNELFQAIELGPLSDSDAIDLLRESGVPPNDTQSINRLLKGHPLALKLAASVSTNQVSARLQETTLTKVVAELATLYLSDIDDPATRTALEAASVVRCVTLSLLSSMLPGFAPQDALERLRALPFVEPGRDGLHIHDSVQQAIAHTLHATDPERHRAYRSSAWRQLQQEVRSAGPRELWRYTADMLYILDNPIVREAFFPSGAHVYAVEPAQRDDFPQVIAISARHEPPSATRFVSLLTEREPQTIWVVRNPDRTVAGFFVLINPDEVSRPLMQSDPILRAWLTHLSSNPVPAGQSVLFAPRNLSSDHGEAPSTIQAASWLETKRTYMEMRPALRRVYFTQQDIEPTRTALSELGFRRIPDADVHLDGVRYHTSMLDFGPSSVDGWLAGLVATELGVSEDEVLDVAARELTVDGKRIALTRLEFAVIQYLMQHEGEAVSRVSLLNDVWGQSYEGGSNVVDVVIRSLRKKLHGHAQAIQTVRGVGYRIRPP